MHQDENTFFTAVVEDINDPEQLGRVRVRIIGLHSADVLELPTHTLPWASVVMPVTSASVGGIGTSATGLLQGSWVTGVFRDGEEQQDPMILGSIPGKSTRPAPSTKAFVDPTGENPIRSGTDLPSPANTELYKNSISHGRKVSLETSGIKTAVAPELKSIDPMTPPPAPRGEWSIPKMSETAAPIYPNNHVRQTTSGHVFECDDTPGHERISEMHCSGTYTETNPDGSRKVVVVGNGYRCVLGDDNIYIQGSCNVTIEGDSRMLVKGDHILEVEGDYIEHIKGSKIQKIGMAHKSEISGEVAQNVGAARKVSLGASDELHINGKSQLVIGGDSEVTVGGADSRVVLGESKNIIGGNFILGVGGSIGIATSSTLALNSTGGMVFTGSIIDLNTI